VYLICDVNVEKSHKCGIVKGIPDSGSTTWKARELKTSFNRGTVRRLVEVERKLSGAHGIRSNK